MSKLTRWWQDLKSKKQEKLKKQAIEQMCLVRMGDASNKENEKACKYIMKALRAGVKFDETDPVWEFLTSPKMKAYMDDAAQGNTGRFHKALKIAACVCGGAALVLGTMAAVAAATTAMPVWAAAAGSALGALGFTVEGAGAIAALVSAGTSLVSAASAFLIGKKERKKNKELWLDFLTSIEGKKNGGGSRGLSQNPKANSRSILRGLSQSFGNTERRKTPPKWLQRLFITSRRNGNDGQKAA